MPNNTSLNNVECIFCLTVYLNVSFPCPLLPMALVLEHGEQCHMQRPSYHGFKALLQSGPLQQADDKCPAHLSACHNHREQDCSPYWHLYRTLATGTQQNPGMRRNTFNCINKHTFLYMILC